MPETENAHSEDAESWRRKYYDSLDQLEAKERDWAELEAMLRDTAARMALALQGLDSTLDRKVEALRTELRGRKNPGQLPKLARSVTEALDQLGERPGQDNSAAFDVLAQLLDALPVPDGAERRARALRKRLTRDPKPDGLRAAVADFTGLLEEAIGQPASDPVSPEPEPPAPAPRGGWWRRWLPGARPAAHAAAGGGVGAGRELLRQVVRATQRDGHGAPALEELEGRLEQSTSERELRHLADELGARLGGANANAPQADVTANEVLLQLLERLEIEGDSAADVEAIQTRLEGYVTPGEWPKLIARIGNLVSRMRSKLLAEKREVEQFLAQLTQRLEDLDGYLRSMESDRRDARAGEREFSDAVAEQVQGLRSSARDAVDISQLRQTIEQRLEAISTHMEQFCQAEEQRDHVAEQRIRELNERLQLMEDEASDLRTRVNKEREMALLDPLTGIYNRMAYEERTEQEFARWKRFGEPLSLVIADIDNFKRINDRYGHKAGDKVLRTIAQVLQKRIRQTDFLARYGGEEFVILMPGANAKNALLVAEELRGEVADCGFHYRGDGVEITICCGVASFAPGDEPDAVFERADRALYQAKDAGKNCSRNAD